MVSITEYVNCPKCGLKQYDQSISMCVRCGHEGDRNNAVPNRSTQSAQSEWTSLTSTCPKCRKYSFDKQKKKCHECDYEDNLLYKIRSEWSGCFWILLAIVVLGLIFGGDSGKTSNTSSRKSSGGVYESGDSIIGGDIEISPDPTPNYKKTFEVIADQVISTATAQAKRIVGCVAVSRLNVRLGPSEDYGARKSLPEGTCVEIIGRDSSSTWVQQKDGWMYAGMMNIQGNFYSLPITSAENQRPSSAKQNQNTTTSSGCPNGCTLHVTGCDIKGNISYNTGEKIYHVPGQEFYSATNISSEYGERWFCTEAEAIANGWRKAKN